MGFVYYAQIKVDTCQPINNNTHMGIVKETLSETERRVYNAWHSGNVSIRKVGLIVNLSHEGARKALARVKKKGWSLKRRVVDNFPG